MHTARYVRVPASARTHTHVRGYMHVHVSGMVCPCPSCPCLQSRPARSRSCIRCVVLWRRPLCEAGKSDSLRGWGHCDMTSRHWPSYGHHSVLVLIPSTIYRPRPLGWRHRRAAIIIIKLNQLLKLPCVGRSAAFACAGVVCVCLCSSFANRRIPSAAHVHTHPPATQ